MDANIRNPAVNDYARGNGFSNTQWDRFDAAQKQAAMAHLGAALRLGFASKAMAEGHPLNDYEKKTVEDFKAVFGRNSATAEHMSIAADRFGKARRVLAEDTNHVAHGYDAKAYDALDRTGPDSFMSVDPRDRTQMRVNLDAADFGKDDKLLWGVAHEPFHSQLIALRDAQGLSDERKLVGAYKYAGKPENNQAYFDLIRRSSQATRDSPEHHTAYAIEKARGLRK